MLSIGILANEFNILPSSVYIDVVFHCSLLRTCRVRVEEKEDYTYTMAFDPPSLYLQSYRDIKILNAAPTDARIFPMYGQNGRLSKVTVQWMRQVRHTVYSSFSVIP